MVQEIFRLENNWKNKSNGICTAASLTWAFNCLRNGRPVKTRGDYESDEMIYIKMAKISQLDADPVDQLSRASLSLVHTVNPGDFNDLIAAMAAHPPHIGIFWNSYHTMGYYAVPGGRDFYFHDQNYGLHLASSGAEIRELYKNRYGDYFIAGGEVVNISY